MKTTALLTEATEAMSVAKTRLLPCLVAFSPCVCSRI